MRAALAFLALLWALLLAIPAVAQDAPRPALTAELGADRIGVSTAFTGSELLVFGTTDRPIGRGGDGIIVSVVGRTEDLVVRRRVRWLGIWVNGPSARYRDVPHTYAVAATTPLRVLLDEDTRFENRLGLDVVTDRLSGSRDPVFRDALRDLKAGRGEWRGRRRTPRRAGRPRWVRPPWTNRRRATRARSRRRRRLNG